MKNVKKSNFVLSICNECIHLSNYQDKWTIFYDYLKKASHSWRVDFETILIDVDPSLTQRNYCFECSENQPYAAQFRILIRTEPRTVMPWNYRKSVQFKYNHAIDACSSPRSQYFWQNGFFDEITRKNAERVMSGKKNRNPGCLVINQNKFSFIPESNYKLRRKIMKSFQGKGLLIYLAGADWNQGLVWTLKQQKTKLFEAIRSRQRIKISNFCLPMCLSKYSIQYLGKVSDKIDVLSNYDFTLIIENESTSITEKLIEALISETIPIYIGPNLRATNLPIESIVLIDLNDINLTVKKVLALSSSEKQIMVQRIRAWKQDQNSFTFWSMTYQFKQLSQLVSNIINNN